MHTRDVLVTVQRGNDGGAISQLLTVLGGWREETLKQSGSGVEHSSTLTASLHADVNLLEVNKVRGDVGDFGVTAPSEVGITKETSQRVGLILKGRVSSERLLPRK